MREEIEKLKTATGRAVNWAQDTENRDLLDRGAISLRRELRRDFRRSNNLLNAIERNNAVAVFGPSQAGKSFLVSTLARPNGGELIADFPGTNGEINYIRDINPEGAGESTGLVTRFTMKKVEALEEYPIKVELLSEYEIICILANSFLSGRVNEDQDQLVETLVKELEVAKTKTMTNPPKLEIEDMWDVQEYLYKEFGDTPYLREIKNHFDEISELAVQLDFESRGKLLSVFWGYYPELTDLYIKLATSLKKLESQKVVFLGTDSLFERNGHKLDKRNSIVDVATLHKINEESAPLKVKVGDKTTVELPRSIICALTAELTIPMKMCPHELFNFTDLLDFPGARNTFKISLEEELSDEGTGVNSENLITNLLLRGKVAFLFDKYVAAQEISAMLLCIPDGNMEVTSLPGLVDNWIAQTLGANTQERSLQKNTLFFVLTKFDTLLIDTAANEGTEDRFKRRVGASLLEKFGKNADKWVRNWTGEEKNFDNLFWLRNPNVGGQQYFELSGETKREVLVESRLERLNQLKEMFLNSHEITTFFKDAKRAWSEAVLPNDGGATYLVESLSGVVNSTTRESQIRAQVIRMSNRMISELRQYHISDDLDERLKSKMNDFQLVEKEFLRLVDEKKFADCLEHLMLDESSLRREFLRIPSHPEILSRFAEKAVEVFHSNLKDFPVATERKFNFKRESATFVIEELHSFMKSNQIEEKILKSISHLTYGADASYKAFAASSISTNLLNSTISSLKKSDDATISPWPAENEKRLEPTRENFARCQPFKMYSNSWLGALKKVIVENANILDGDTINREQNGILGNIIKDIEGNTLEH